MTNESDNTKACNFLLMKSKMFLLRKYLKTSIIALWNNPMNFLRNNLSLYNS